MIDEQTVQRIIDSAQILDVVQDFMTLKRRGANYIGCCPFHNEKTPSFSVSPSKNIFKCFGCGVAGTPISFVMRHENMTYPEALKYVANKYGIIVKEKELSAEEMEEHEDRESMGIVNQFAEQYFHNQLLNEEEGKAIGLTYFQHRGFRPETIEKFMLGYSPSNRQALTNEALAKGYKLKFREKTGLTIVKEDGYKFDRFAGRVMFPIHSVAGKVVAFGGRIMTNDKKLAKYVNSPESEVYHKSNVLYGIYQAKSEIVKRDKCYLCEGYCDVISMHQSGVTNTVASSGTSLTPGQISVIKRFTNNLTVIYDGDWAGIKASLRGIDLILAQDINVKVVLLPDGEDPDSYALSHTPQELQEYIDSHEEDFIRFKTRILLKDAEDPLKKAEVIKSIITSISKISNQVTRSIYIKECGKLLDVKEDALYAETGREIKKNREEEIRQQMRQGIGQPDLKVVTEDRETPENQPVENGVGEGTTVPGFVKNIYSEVEEMEIVNYLINFGDKEFEQIQDPTTGYVNSVNVATYIIGEILNDEMEFNNLLYKSIFDDYCHHLEEDKKIDTAYFLNSPDEKVRDLAVQLTIPKHSLSDLWKRRGVECLTPEDTFRTDIPKTINSYKLKIITQATKDTIERLKTVSPDELMATMAQLKQLKNVEKELSKSLKRTIIV
jgi:DNA primase